MATRGYQSYRGRNHGKLALVIVLVLILLAAVGYLVAQEYMVYDDEGHRHLELPFLKKGQTERPQQPEDTTPDDVDLIIDEPEHPLLKELHARQLPDTVLTEDPSAVLAEHPEIDMVIDLHRDGVNENLHFITDINGKATAKVMLFNGISYSNNQGDIDYLYNPYLKENLALTYQMYLLGKTYYPDFFRCIYIEAYRYNLHLS